MFMLPIVECDIVVYVYYLITYEKDFLSIPFKWVLNLK